MGKFIFLCGKVNCLWDSASVYFPVWEVHLPLGSFVLPVSFCLCAFSLWIWGYLYCTFAFLWVQPNHLHVVFGVPECGAWEVKGLDRAKRKVWSGGQLSCDICNLIVTMLLCIVRFLCVRGLWASFPFKCIWAYGYAIVYGSPRFLLCAGSLSLLSL